LWNSPQAGALFETLVFSEIVKTRDNHQKTWRLHTWRTKESAEIDFILEDDRRVLFLEAKLGIHGAAPILLDAEARKVFKPPFEKIVVTAGGEIAPVDRETRRVPLRLLGDFLLGRLN
jgi:predicted AAA+ superfamily ATPase